MIGGHLAIEPLLGGLPADWPVSRFKAIANRRDRRNTDLSEPMMSLKSSGEVVPRDSLGQRQEPDESNLPRYLIAKPGDLIVNPMWLVGGAVGVTEVSGAVSPDYRVFEPRAHYPRYLHYLLRTPHFIDQYRLYTRAQTTFDRRVQQPDLDNLPVPVPPVEQQRAIADYLDRETTQIDTLITKQERLIATLRERRRGLIANAVLGRQDPLHPTEGFIPIGAAYSVTLGKMLDAGKSRRRDDIELPYLRAANIQDHGLDLDDIKSMPYSPAEAAILDLRAGDLLVVEGGAVGTCTVLRRDMPGWSFQKTVNRLRPRPNSCSSWLAYVLRTYRDAGVIDIVCNKSTIPHLTAEKLRALRVPSTSIGKQHEIAAYLDEHTAKIDTLIAKAERFIELSKERRSALITAAVTAQLDVRASA